MPVPKDPGQTQQRDVVVERRALLARPEHPIDARHASREIDHRPRRHEQHRRAQRLHERCVSDVLQHIAQSLLDVQQDGLAAQVLARPHGQPEVTARRQLRLRVPAEIVELPGFAKSPGGKERAGIGAISMRRRPLREIALACRDGFARPPHDVQAHRMVHEDVGVAILRAFQVHGTFQRRQRFRRAILTVERHAEMDPGHRVVSCAFHGIAKLSLRCARVTLFEQEVAQSDPAPRVARIVRDGALEAASCLVAILIARKRRRQRAPYRSRIATRGCGPRQPFPRSAGFAAVQIRKPELQGQIVLAPARRFGLDEGGLGFARAPPCVQRLRANEQQRRIALRLQERGVQHRQRAADFACRDPRGRCDRNRVCIERHLGIGTYRRRLPIARLRSFSAGARLRGIALAGSEDSLQQ